MIITYGTTDVSLDPPLFGYSTLLDIAFTIAIPDNNIPVVWDDGPDYDTRICKCNLLLDKTQMNSLVDIFRLANQGRGKQLYLTLGSIPSGFFPFGPDRGDKGTFQIATLSPPVPKASIGHPEDYFNLDCELVNTGAFPSYKIPAQINDGHLNIGDIHNLRYPQAMHEQDIEYNVQTNITSASDAFSNDKASGSDKFFVKMALDQYATNMAALIDYLSNTRVHTFSITPPNNAWLFGRENGDGPFTCQWIDKQIEIIHRNYNDFGVNLTFAKVA